MQNASNDEIPCAPSFLENNDLSISLNRRTCTNRVRKEKYNPAAISNTTRAGFQTIPLTWETTFSSMDPKVRKIFRFDGISFSFRRPFRHARPRPGICHSERSEGLCSSLVGLLSQKQKSIHSFPNALQGTSMHFSPSLGMVKKALSVHICSLKSFSALLLSPFLCHSERSEGICPPLVISSSVKAFRPLSFRAEPQAESRNLYLRHSGFDPESFLGIERYTSAGFFCPGAWTLLLHASFSGYAWSGRRLTANSLS